MTRVPLLLAALAGVSCIVVARAADSVEHAAVAALAGTYSFQVTGAPIDGCWLTLDHAPVLRRGDLVLRQVDLSSDCRAWFSFLRGVTRWAATGGASIALFGGDPVAEASDFSPVQDATGVYLRGGFSGDDKIYELRRLTE